MKTAILYSDMDGVIADFYGAAHKLLGHSWRDPNLNHLSKEDRGQIINRHAGFWENIPPMTDFHTYWGYIEKYAPHILTACPEWAHEYSEVYIGKWNWVQRHIPGFPKNRFHVVKRSEKAQYARQGAHPNVLIDDYKKNILEFEAAGGVGVHHHNAKSTIILLKELGFH